MIERELYERSSKEGMFYSFNDNFKRASISDAWTDMENLANKIVDNFSLGRARK